MFARTLTSAESQQLRSSVGHTTNYFCSTPSNTEMSPFLRDFVKLDENAADNNNSNSTNSHDVHLHTLPSFCTSLQSDGGDGLSWAGPRAYSKTLSDAPNEAL
uniref:Protein fanF n=1 Tax=Lygus hesperus TaxID=30085 RepID=A0A0A9Y928_LYGHE